MTQPKDTPLQAVIEDNQIVIRIGLSTLAFCALAKHGGPLPENYRICDEGQFAKDVVHELLASGEVGNTRLTDMLDAAIERATDQGSTGVKQLKRKAREL